MKRYLFTTICLSLFISTISFAGTIIKVNDLYYDLNKNDFTAKVTTDNQNKYKTLSSAVVSDTVEYGNNKYVVTSIGSNAFKDCYSIKSVTLSQSIRTIEESAFYNSGLTTIVFNDNLVEIGIKSFYKCVNLTSVIIPDSAHIIRDYAFSGCTKLASVKLGLNIDTISIEAFRSCGFSTFEFNEGIKYIGENVFYGCNKLNSIEIPQGITTISNGLFNGCTSLSSIILPSGIERIGNSAFANCSQLGNIALPNTVTDIQPYAFSYCSALTSISIPGSVTIIGEGAFHTCKKLASVELGDKLKSIRDKAFWGCESLKIIEIPSSVDSIGHGIFSFCYSLTAINVSPDNRQYYSADGVLYNNLQDTLIRYPLGKEGDYMIPEGTKVLGVESFAYCKNMGSVTLPNTLIEIGEHAFSTCNSLTTIEMPMSVRVIGGGAFSWSNLDSVAIHSTVESMGAGVFSGCSKLNVVVSYSVIPKTITSEFFYMVDKSLCKLYVPEESVDIYKSTDYWKEFNNIFPITWKESKDTEGTEDVPVDSTNKGTQYSKLLKDGRIVIKNKQDVFSILGSRIQ